METAKMLILNGTKNNKKSLNFDDLNGHWVNLRVSRKNVRTSWDCTGPSSAQTGTLFYFIQDLLHKIG